MPLKSFIFVSQCLLMVALPGCVQSPVDSQPEHLILEGALEREARYRSSLIEEITPMLEFLSAQVVETDADVTRRFAESACIAQYKEENLQTHEAALLKAEVELQAAQDNVNEFAQKYPRHQKRKWCGTDGCDGSCSSLCGTADVCQDSYCQCVPDCKDKACGSDGCGGVCGVCEGESYCTSNQTCSPPEIEPVICFPSCSLGGRPKRSSSVKKKRPSPYRGSRDTTRGYFASLEDLEVYASLLKVRLKTFKATIASRGALEGALESKRSTLIASQDALKAATANTKNARASVGAARVKARQSGDGEVAAEIIKQANEEIKVAVQAEVAAKLAVQNANSAVKDASNAMSSFDKGVDEQITLSQRYDAELTRVQSFLLPWRAAKNTRDDAAESLELARASLAAKVASLDELTGDFLSDIEQRKANAQALMLTSSERHTLSCQAPRCPLGPRLWGLDDNLDPLEQIVEKLQGHLDKQKEWKDSFTDKGLQKLFEEVKSVDSDSAKALVFDMNRQLGELPPLPFAYSFLFDTDNPCKKALSEEIFASQFEQMTQLVPLLNWASIKARSSEMEDAKMLLVRLESSNKRLLALRDEAIDARSSLFD